MAQKILVIDDEPEIVKLVQQILESEGFGFDYAYSSDSAFQKIEKGKPDLIILDLKLPGVGGKELCQILKKREETSDIPIIMLSGKYLKPQDRTEGLEMGADDYITKPFYGNELVARVKAILRRLDYGKETEEALKTSNGEIIINITTHTAQTKEGNKYKDLLLTPKEFDLLFTLLKKKNRVLDRNYLMESVWGLGYFGTTRTVDVHIGNLRQKLGSYADKIETIEGIGYKFID